MTGVHRAAGGRRGRTTFSGSVIVTFFILGPSYR